MEELDMSDHTFNETVESLFKGMDNFLTTKTVVGEAIHVNDTLILPLVDVSFGVGAGAWSQEHKNSAGGGMGGKMTVLFVWYRSTTMILSARLLIWHRM